MISGPSSTTTSGTVASGVVEFPEGSTKPGGRVTLFSAAQVSGERPFFLRQHVPYEGEGKTYIGTAEVLHKAEGRGGAAPWEKVLVGGSLLWGGGKGAGIQRLLQHFSPCSGFTQRRGALSLAGTHST